MSSFLQEAVINNGLHAAGSRDRRNTALVCGHDLSHHFVWGAEPEAFAGPVVEVVLGGLDLLAAALAQVGALREVLAEQARWTLLCLSSGVGEAVERGGWVGGGLDAAVEPSSERAFEAAADISMRLALGGAFGFVGPGFVVAAQSGDRDRV